MGTQTEQPVTITANHIQQEVDTFRPKEHCLSEIKTLLRILNTWGNAFVPDLEGKSVRAQERLTHFVELVQKDYGMTLEEIETAIA